MQRKTNNKNKDYSSNHIITSCFSSIFCHIPVSRVDNNVSTLCILFMKKEHKCCISKNAVEDREGIGANRSKVLLYIHVLTTRF